MPKYKNIDISELIKKFSKKTREELALEKKEIKIAGRIREIKNFGKKLTFAFLVEPNKDWKSTKNESKIQVIFEEKLIKVLNCIISAKGIICRTKTGELSVKISSWTIISKCLKEISYKKIEDVEERFRHRTLDLIVNPESRRNILMKSKMIEIIRYFLKSKNFIEIETPILVPSASGAQAKPFITHYNSLKSDFYLRIATEINLKKLLTGGFNKIFEIGKVFRNEGIDSRHSPEFITIELYAAYEDSRYMMRMTEKLIKSICKIFGKYEFSINGRIINLKEKFKRMTMIESIKKYFGLDLKRIKSINKLREIVEGEKIELKSYQNTRGQMIKLLFDKHVEKKIMEPTFIEFFPLETSPLSEEKKGKKGWADRFELYIGGFEIANGYSELNDAEEQIKRFDEQLKQKEMGEEETDQGDESFIDALRLAMPPAGGLGIGIDRLAMILLETKNIREVISIPQLKSIKIMK